MAFILEIIYPLYEYSDIGTHWVALYMRNNNVTYFASFWVGNIPKEIKAFIDHSLSITTITYTLKEYDSIMSGYFALVLLILCLQERP